MTIKIGFIGLGTMGLPMANCLIKKGYKLKVYDTSSVAMEKIDQDGVTLVNSPKEAAKDANFCITMLPESSNVRDAVLGKNGLVENMNKDSMLIEMSTILPSATMSIYEHLKSKKIKMIDAPVGRTPTDAVNGKLLVIAGGDKNDIQIAKPILKSMSDEIIHVGPITSGIRMKLVNNYMSMVGMVMTAETILFANKVGINQDLAVKVLQGTAAGKGQINVNFPKKVLSGDLSPDFPMKMGLKDISLALELGDDKGLSLNLGRISKEYFALASKFNRQNQDCTAMLHLIEDISNLNKEK